MSSKIYSLLIGFGLAGLIALSAPAFAADVLSPACNAIPPGDRATAAACQGNTNQPTARNSIYGPNGILTRAASFMGILVGVASVIMIVVGGFKYVTSSGDPSNLKSAKDTILFAVIGILVAVAAQSIVVYVLSRL